MEDIKPLNFINLAIIKDLVSLMPARSNEEQTNHNPKNLLLVLKPRQVMLAELNAKATPSMKPCSETLTLGPERRKSLLIHSILGFLARYGFSRTLKRLLSEAQIEDDGWKACVPNLEDIYCKHLDTCDTKSAALEQEVPPDASNGFTKEDIDVKVASMEETVGKKKKRKGDGNIAPDPSGKGSKSAEFANHTGEILQDKMGTDSTVKLKEQSKNLSDSLGQVEEINAAALKEHANGSLCGLEMGKLNEKQKDKKKRKSKSASELLEVGKEQAQLGSVPAVIEEKSEILNSSMDDGKGGFALNIEGKDKKKKKKASLSPVGEHVKQHTVGEDGTGGPGLLGEEAEDKSKLAPSKDKNRIGNEERGKSKDKGKKSKLSVDSLVKNVEQCSFGGNTNREDVIDKEKKSYKKRKRSVSEENEHQTVESVTSEQTKRVKSEVLEELKINDPVVDMNSVTGDDGRSGNKKKAENSHVGDNQFQETSTRKQHNEDNSNAQKSTRKQLDGSTEPKTLNAFRRVKVEDVVFTNERLQDNSYWAKDGADVGYGAKAQEVLGQVRGRDFRHEKTKKKRGSYRGGLIDLQSHSIKFNSSDEE